MKRGLIALALMCVLAQVVVYAVEANGAAPANKFCPVSGDAASIDGGSVEYKGKIYHLCCPMCAEEFNKDPEGYIAKMETKEKSGIPAESMGDAHH